MALIDDQSTVRTLSHNEIQLTVEKDKLIGKWMWKFGGQMPKTLANSFSYKKQKMSGIFLLLLDFTRTCPLFIL